MLSPTSPIGDGWGATRVTFSFSRNHFLTFLFIEVFLIALWPLFSTSTWTPPPDPEHLDFLVDAYSVRYGKPPPVNFAKWVSYAKEHKCPWQADDQSESAYRMIYFHYQQYLERFLRDIERNQRTPTEPIFSPQLIDRIANFSDWTTRVNVVNGSASDSRLNDFFTDIAYLLPDMSIILNLYDEPRIPVTTDTIEGKSVEGLNYAPLERRYTHSKKPASLWPFYRQICNSHIINGHLNSVLRNSPVQEESLSMEEVLAEHGCIHPDSADFFIDSFPMFSASSLPGCFLDFVVPDYLILPELPKLNMTSPSWEEKMDVVYWRGATTGAHIYDGRPDLYRRTHRFRFVRKFQNSPGWDIGFVKWAQLDNDSKEAFALEAYTPLKPYAPFENHLSYRWLPDIDGNTYSRRFLPFMFTESVTLKGSLFIDAILTQAVPWEHYVPIRLDYSDVQPKLEYLRDHQDVAKGIADRAKRLGQEKLNIEFFRCYWARLLLEYHEMCNAIRSVHEWQKLNLTLDPFSLLAPGGPNWNN